MNNSVVIKGMSSGLIILLDSNLPYDVLRNDIITKFETSASFLGQADVAVSFDGRDLSDAELMDILGIIHEKTMLNVICVLFDDPVKDAWYQQRVEDRLMEIAKNTASFYKGNIRSGKTMDFPAGVVILGNVSDGAVVNAGGNVLVLGSVEGEINAGRSGNKRAFVYAVKLCPTKLSIAGYTYLSGQTPGASKHKMSLTKKKSSGDIAYVELGKITIKQLTDEIIHELKIQ